MADEQPTVAPACVLCGSEDGAGKAGSLYFEERNLRACVACVFNAIVVAKVSMTDPDISSRVLARLLRLGSEIPGFMVPPKEGNTPR